MNILDYIDLKRKEFEDLESESQLQLLNNKNIIEKLSAQMIEFTAEEDPNRFFLPEAEEPYEDELEKLQKRIDDIKSENKVLEENIKKIRLELKIIDELELPEPMGKEDKDITTDDNISIGENKDTTTDDNIPIGENNVFIADNPELKNQLEFCMKIAELDGHRCRLELRQILEKLENVSRETFSEK